MLSKAGIECTMLALLGLWSQLALATPDGDTTRAAELFEQGVRQFASADYEAAAKAFLGADELAPNSRALLNGLTAARRAGLHLLVARAAQRALGRSDIDASGAALAREALAESAHHLTKVNVTCAPSPCTVTLDGAQIALGAQYVLPGIHDFAASGATGAPVSEHLNTVAGASYRVTLTLKPPVREAPPPTRATASERRPKPFAPAVFFAGAAGTAALVGVTIWSGLDTLSAKSSATHATWDHVESSALRTDLLLAGAVLLGGATAAAGIWGTEWGSSGASASATLLPGGGAVVAQGRF